MSLWKSGDSPELGISTVRLLLHSVPWQHCTMTPDSSGELPHCTASSSVPTMHPFCRRAVPFRMEAEEKHCWPKQRPLLPHDCPSHTHSKSFTVALSARDTHICTHGWVNHSSSLFYLQYCDAESRQCQIVLQRLLKYAMQSSSETQEGKSKEGHRVWDSLHKALPIISIVD